MILDSPRFAVPLLGLAFFAATAQAQSDRSYRTLSASRQAVNEADVSVDVRFSLGHFNFGRDQTGALYRTTLVYDEDLFDPIQRYDRDNRTLTIDIGGEDGDSRSISLRQMRDLRQRLDMTVSPSVPTRVKMVFGVVAAQVDLGGISLIEADITTGASESTLRFSRPTVAPCERLRVAMGAAEFSAERLGNSNCADMEFEGAAGAFTLDFTGEWQRQGEAEARVKVGVGALELRFPSRLGVALSLNRFLASFDRSGFEKRGDTYYSSNYDTAQTKLKLDVKAVLGHIEVVWVP